MELHEFIQNKQNEWSRLERHLKRLEEQGVEAQNVQVIKEVLALYRRASSDLNQAQTYYANAELLEYLHQLVSRGYSLIYSRAEKPRVFKNLLRFFTHTFVREIYQARYYVFSALSFFMAGALFGAAMLVFDSTAGYYMFPEQFSHLHDPQSHATGAEESDRINSVDDSAAFSAHLMANNIKVSIFAMALGVTAGIGTAVLLFYNGAILGGAIMNFLLAGKAVFVTAWISPHGVIEIPAIILGGSAGFIIARAMLAPGRRSIRHQLSQSLERLVHIILGVSAMLVLAGCIEGSISQFNERQLSSVLKIVFAVLLLIAELAYFIFLGRKRDREATENPAT